MSFFNLFRQRGQESTAAAKNTNKTPIEEQRCPRSYPESSESLEHSEHSEHSEISDGSEMAAGMAAGTMAAGYAELPGTDADSDTDPVFLHHIRAGFWDTDKEAE